jgi:tRNA G37 N-methylase TrmD
MPHFPRSDGRPPFRVTAITLFPDLFPGPLGASLTGQALAAELWTMDTVDIRAFGIGRHRTVDDHPVGGGPGMVLRADVAAAAIDEARARSPDLPPKSWPPWRCRAPLCCATGSNWFCRSPRFRRGIWCWCARAGGCRSMAS